eukprot:7169883-Alexandrium_andersonii.AAC.1
MRAREHAHARVRKKSVQAGRGWGLDPPSLAENVWVGLGGCRGAAPGIGPRRALRLAPAHGLR